MSGEFFEHGINRLLETVQSGILCAFDFDGTIAPLVDDPSAARIPPPLLRHLAALAEFAPVAVISGRSVEDISLNLDFFPHFLIGNHGIEGLSGQEQREERYRLNCRHWMQKLRSALSRAHCDPAIWIEDKVYSLAIHYLLVEDPLATQRRLLDLVRKTTPDARVFSGKCVLNLLPADAPDKSIALNELVSMIVAPAAIYVGDDVADETVFKLPRDRLLALRVGEAEQTAAEFHRQDISAMASFLDMLLDSLKAVMTADAALASFAHR